MNRPYWDEERLARAALTAVIDPGDARLHSVIKADGAAACLAQLQASDKDTMWTRRARKIDAAQLVRAADQHGIRFITPNDSEWPASLNDLDECVDVNGMAGRPIGIWARGPAELAECSVHSLAIVGARAATHYGAGLATRFADALSGGASGQFTVISGGAYGIDAAAHRGALLNGRTVGVFAGGLHEPYPKANGGLFDRMVRDHLVISEAPPGFGQTKPGFLARNRLIAALTLGTIVVEAAARSGALNTASWADALSRPVLAVPGPVTSETSIGCNRLIRDGRAQLVSDEKDILAAISPISCADLDLDQTESRPIDRLDRYTLAVHEALPSRGTKSVDEIALRAGLSTSHTMALLAELELFGMAKRNDQQRWRLSRSANGVVPMAG